MKNKDTLISISSILVVIAVAIIGISYAYFSVNIDGEGNTVSTRTTNLEITFSDNTEITLNNAYPSDHSSKTFNIENTGTKAAVYELNWNITTNTYLYDELVYSLECTSYKYYGTASQVQEGTCPTRTNIPVPLTNANAVVGITIGKDITHVYSLNVLFMEMSSLQNYNLEASFSGVLEPAESAL